MDWKTKLTSRKLWVAVGDFVGMLLVAFGVAEDTVTQVVALIMAGAGLIAYIIAEGLVDAKAAEIPTAVIPAEAIEYVHDGENPEGVDPDGV
jgi:hypothetical protein